MIKIKVSFFLFAHMVATTCMGMAATDATCEEPSILLEQPLEEAFIAGDEDVAKDFEAEARNLLGDDVDAESDDDTAEHEQVVPESFVSPAREQAPVVSADQQEKIKYASKVSLVFDRFMDMKLLGQEAFVLAQIMKNSFTRLLDAQLLTAEAKARITYFVEAAGLLKCQVQILTVRPNMLRQYFNNLVVPRIEEHYLNDLYVQILYEMYKSSELSRLVADFDQAALNIHSIHQEVSTLVVDTMFEVLHREDIVDLSPLYYSVGVPYCGSLSVRRHRQPTIKKLPLYVFSKNSLSYWVDCDSQIIDLIQKYFDLEFMAKAAPALSQAEKDRLMPRFIKQADALREQFLKQEVSYLNKGLKIWTNLFVGKIVLLMRDLMVRMHVTSTMHKSAVVQDVYFKHMVIVKDQMFDELTLYPKLRGYVSRYESLVTRFLSEQQEAKLDFWCELYALHNHFSNRVIASKPTGVFLWLKEKVGMECKRVEDEKYYPVLENMAQVLELIEKALKPDPGILQNVLGNILTATGGTLDGKGTAMQLLTNASPLLATALKRYVQGDATAGAEVKKQAVQAGVPLASAQPTIDQNFIAYVAQVEAKFPGLIAELLKHQAPAAA
jgi:hypothetical protein